MPADWNKGALSLHLSSTLEKSSSKYCYEPNYTPVLDMSAKHRLNAAVSQPTRWWEVRTPQGRRETSGCSKRRAVLLSLGEVDI